MIGQVQTINGQKQIVPMTGGVPDGSVGSLIMKYKKIQPKNCLYCDGRDTTGTDEELRIYYPALYMYLGSNVLPDYRECVMVGAEQNTTDAIATHDVFTQGQFKDDTLKTHGGHLPQGSWSGRGSYYMDNAKCMGNFTGGAYGWQVEQGNEMRPVRIEVGDSSVTRTKQKAVYVYIVAVDSVAVSDDESFLRVVANYIDEKNSYSTTEQLTGGTWIDGKPIYRKVCPLSSFTIQQGNAVDVSVSGLPSDVSRYFKASVYCYDSGSSLTTGMFGGIIVKAINKSTNKVAIYNTCIGTHIQSDANPYLILEYTKAT